MVITFDITKSTRDINTMLNASKTVNIIRDRANIYIYIKKKQLYQTTG